MRWEYHTLKIKPGRFAGRKDDGDPLGRALTELGEQGWELCSNFEMHRGGEEASADIVLIFKRPGDDVFQAQAM